MGVDGVLLSIFLSPFLHRATVHREKVWDKFRALHSTALVGDVQTPIYHRAAQHQETAEQQHQG